LATSWWEIRVLCDPDAEDLVFWRLTDFGSQGTSSETAGHAKLVRAYLPQQQTKVLDLSALALFLRQDALCAGLPIPDLQWEMIEEEDWSSTWKQYWAPQEVGDRFLINPAWLPEPDPTDRLVIRLDPGFAFGTGSHPTTQLCLEALEMRLDDTLRDPHQPMVIADVGCGSGILSVGALLLGADRLLAVDIDPLAVETTRNSMDLNQVGSDRLIVKEGSIGTIAEMTAEPVDGILCNILAEVIVDLIPGMGAIAKPSTWGILSGILLDQVKPVADTLEDNGWIVATLWRRDEWCCLNIRRT